MYVFFIKNHKENSKVFGFQNLFQRNLNGCIQQLSQFLLSQSSIGANKEQVLSTSPTKVSAPQKKRFKKKNGSHQLDGRDRCISGVQSAPLVHTRRHCSCCHINCQSNTVSRRFTEISFFSPRPDFCVSLNAIRVVR